MRVAVGAWSSALSSQINHNAGIKESDTGLAPPSQWDLVADKQMLQEEQPLQVRICCWLDAPRKVLQFD